MRLTYLRLELLERAHTGHVIHISEGRILQRIEKHHLPLNILNEPKQQVKPLLGRGVGSMPLKKILDDLNRTQVPAISLLTVGR